MNEDLHPLFMVTWTKFGLNRQLTKTVEEAAELQKEICKILISPQDPFEQQQIKLAEEVADLELMLEQVKWQFNLWDRVNSVREKKLDYLRGLVGYKEPLLDNAEAKKKPHYDQRCHWTAQKNKYGGRKR